MYQFRKARCAGRGSALRAKRPMARVTELRGTSERAVMMAESFTAPG
jgi:hypothetical protein